jgi:hypothetical protein
MLCCSRSGAAYRYVQRRLQPSQAVAAAVAHTFSECRA